MWSYNGNNELLSDTTATYEYDDNGNTTRKTEGAQVTVYEYNDRNRLSTVSLPDGRVATYAYDPFGRRVKKDVANTVTYFAYADEGLVGEYSEQGAPLTERGQPLTLDTTKTDPNNIKISPKGQALRHRAGSSPLLSLKAIDPPRTSIALC